jgi:hypothetical protein
MEALETHAGSDKDAMVKLQALREMVANMERVFVERSNAIRLSTANAQAELEQLQMRTGTDSPTPKSRSRKGKKEKKSRTPKVTTGPSPLPMLPMPMADLGLAGPGYSLTGMAMMGSTSVSSTGMTMMGPSFSEASSMPGVFVNGGVPHALQGSGDQGVETVAPSAPQIQVQAPPAPPVEPSKHELSVVPELAEVVALPSKALQPSSKSAAGESLSTELDNRSSTFFRSVFPSTEELPSWLGPTPDPFWDGPGVSTGSLLRMAPRKGS